MKKQYKGIGWGQKMLDLCIEDAKLSDMKGVAVISRKGSWMASKDIFIKNGFELADSSKPDFELYALNFKGDRELPEFKGDLELKLDDHKKGLVIVSSDQCPYIEKAVREIKEKAISDFAIDPEIIKLENYGEAQNSACAFGTFYIVLNGKIVADRPVSKTRFANIMKKEL
jgi:hypothetical protein